MNIKKISTFLKQLIFYSFLSCFVAKTMAHPMPNSVIALHIQARDIEASLQLPLTELELAFGKKLNDHTAILIDSFGTELKAYIEKHIKVTSLNGQLWKIQANELNLASVTQETIGQYNELIVKVLMSAPLQETNRKFTMNYDVILHQVATHSALVSIQQDWQNGIQSEQTPLEIGVIAWDIPSNTILPFTVNLAEGSIWKGFKSMVGLGMSHIWEGTDHLLFLLMLLLPAPLLVENRRWSRYIGLKESSIKLLRIITAFTLGHSLTLILGTLGLVPFSSRWIEIWIAVSILISAIHAIFPLFYKKETYIAAGFGLIHGLAFSNTLIDLSLSATQTGLSILGFNLGIELMQLLMMCAILPSLLVICSHSLSFYHNIRSIGAAAAIIAAFAWMLERITQQSNLITRFLENAPSHLVSFILFIALLAIISWRKNRDVKY
jgi:hypothetical protein